MAMKSINSRSLSAAAAVSLICALLLADFAAADPGTAGFFVPRSAATACPGRKGLGKLVAAADILVFRGGKACGQRFEVTCTGAGCKKGKKVVVEIVDTCSPTTNRPCQTLTLSRAAFAAIANPNAGVVSVNFKQLK
ncbi:unnamed protein product [Linum tenue]|uniref:Expansin-like EG45 domain-containing protein n=1 Tax=Linum tenue TaxID=586396 RepID=A0AAV0GTP2_9ROSI|nr:unnamed protein product [Linum tenue]